MKVFATIDARKFNDDKFLNEALSNASEFRKKKYDSINNELGKLQVLANTYLLNICLKEFGKVEKDMEYVIEKNGKLRFANADDIHFNLSHSKNMSLAVVSDKPVGCDIQFIDKVDEKIFDLVLSADEKKLVTGASDIVGAGYASPNEIFYRLWSMKEAVIKKDGSGLRDRLTNVHDENVYIEKRVLRNKEEVENYILAII